MPPLLAVASLQSVVIQQPSILILYYKLNKPFLYQKRLHSLSSTNRPPFFPLYLKLAFRPHFLLLLYLDILFILHSIYIPEILHYPLILITLINELIAPLKKR
jgi:hypothetical protein